MHSECAIFFPGDECVRCSAVLPVRRQAPVKLTGEFSGAQAPTETSVFFAQNLRSGVLAPRANSVQIDRNCMRKPGTKTGKERGSSSSVCQHPSNVLSADVGAAHSHLVLNRSHIFVLMIFSDSIGSF